MEVSAWDFLEHYINYLTSPAVITLIILGLSLVFSSYLQGTLDIFPKTNTVAGCVDIRLARRRTLKGDVFDERINKVKALFTYPLRSCKGIELVASHVDSSGLRYDGLFTFTRLVSTSKSESQDPSQHWQSLTTTECPRLDRLSIQLFTPTPLRSPRPGLSKSRGHNRESKPATNFAKGPAMDSYYENGGCLVIKFPHSPSYNPLGVLTTEKVIQIPLSPTRERAKARGYDIASGGSATYLDDGQSRTGLHMTSEIDGQTLLALQKFLGVGPLSLFRTCQELDSVHMERPAGLRMVGLPSTSSGPASPNANVYLTCMSTIGRDDMIVMGRRMTRTKQGLTEIDGEYSVSKSSIEDGTYVLDPLFEQGLLRVGDEIQVQNRHNRHPA